MESKTRASLATVSADDAGRRLDNFLLTRLKGVPRSRVYRMIRGGEVRVNGRRARPDGRLEEGDQVRVPPVQISRRAAPPGPAANELDWLNDRIVYEDRDVLVLDKPAGLAVHGGSGVSFGAIELLRKLRPEHEQLELVHRLDRDTSGCLLFARRRSALRRLHAQFREGEVRKEYIALLCGRLRGQERFIDRPLSVHRRRGGERHVQVDPEHGKPARSRFTPRRRYASATVVDVVIETGRTHQIRVHAADLGHPVAGDTRYGGEVSERLARRLGLERLFLHAGALTFDSPRDGRVIRVECPLDAALTKVLDRLDARRD
ncbi:MAG TPA: RluA family pseudouridine synthase [Chromatiales bacterium]|nr:RluA family pseudouridine synthase [Chromatiales bacterium]